MHIGPDCYACFMKQALTCVKLCTDDSEQQVEVLVRVGKMFEEFDPKLPSPENLIHMYRFISSTTGVADPFATIKKEANDFVLSIQGDVEKEIKLADDSLLAAIRFAISGNVLDNAAPNQLDIHETIAGCLKLPLDINDYSTFLDKLTQSEKILYLTDNCGEIVFDKLLVQQLVKQGKDVTVAVRGMPVINDATLEDARYCQLDTVCKVVSNGADVPGTTLDMCTDEFQKMFAEADLIISKGMGNFECLSEVVAPICYLLTIKCSTVLDYLQNKFPELELKIGSPVVHMAHLSA